MTNKGRIVRLRQILPEDAPLLVDIFDHMSSESLYKRFNQILDSVVPERIWEEALHIAQADPKTCRGLIAFVDLTPRQAVPVGAVRYVENAFQEAEVAISIRDDFQNMGIGTHLMCQLAFDAKDAGYRLLTASIRNDNPPIWRVFKRLPFKVERVVEGSFAKITIYLDVPAVQEIDSVQHKPPC